MDEEDFSEFQDWELLQPDSNSESTHEIALLQLHPDYFSLVAQKSDDPNPNRCLDKDEEEEPEPAAFSSDSGTQQSQDGNFTHSPERDEESLSEKGEIFCSDSSGFQEGSASGELDDFAPENFQVGDVNLPEVTGDENEKFASGGKIVHDTENKKPAELEKRSLMWWQMPMEFLKYCVCRMSPAWTVSVAAAVMGFLILGRRLYKMKKKTRGLEIKVAVDDKKVSQVMSRAARLNEAFSVVKRVPIIRPLLPAVRSTGNWPAMSLR